MLAVGIDNQGSLISLCIQEVKSDCIGIIPQISSIMEWECYMLIDKVYVSISLVIKQKNSHGNHIIEEQLDMTFGELMNNYIHIKL